MRATGLVLLSLTAGACATARPASREPAENTPRVVQRDTVRVPVAIRPAESAPQGVQRGTASTPAPMAPDEAAKWDRAAENAPRATALRATTDTVRLRVGEFVPPESLPLTMVDSTGRPLGPLPLYDLFVGKQGVVDISGLGIVAVRAGVQQITVGVPAAFLGAGREGGPRAALYFVVRDR